MREAIAKARSGDRGGAIKLIMAHLREHQDDATAWLWLAYLLPDRERAYKAAETAFSLDPDSERAREWVNYLQPEIPKARRGYHPLYIGTVAVLVLIILSFFPFVLASGGGDDSAVPMRSGRPASYVKITSLDCGEERSSHRILTGRVHNTHDSRALGFVFVRGILLDGRGRQVNSSLTLISSDRIAPRGSSTFSIMIDNPGVSVDACKVEVSSARFTD